MEGARDAAEGINRYIVGCKLRGDIMEERTTAN